MSSTQESCLDESVDGQLLNLSVALHSNASSQEGFTSLRQLSPAALAYVGDAVYELHMRTRYLFPPKRLQAYHNQVVSQVRAESQARHLRSLHPHLSEGEREIVRRGRNAATKRPKRVNAEVYQQATGLEALLGYLYLSDLHRLMQLLNQLETDPLQAAPESAH